VDEAPNGVVTPHTEADDTDAYGFEFGCGEAHNVLLTCGALGNIYLDGLVGVAAARHKEHRCANEKCENSFHHNPILFEVIIFRALFVIYQWYKYIIFFLRADKCPQKWRILMTNDEKIGD
jgi:hypothetical protein